MYPGTRVPIREPGRHRVLGGGSLEEWRQGGTVVLGLAFLVGSGHDERNLSVPVIMDVFTTGNEGAVPAASEQAQK